MGFLPKVFSKYLLQLLQEEDYSRAAQILAQPPKGFRGTHLYFSAVALKRSGKRCFQFEVERDLEHREQLQQAQREFCE